MEILILILMVAAFVVWILYVANKRKRKRLFDKYQDEEIVEKIMARQVWQGMSEEQLTDSWGKPADRDQKVYKTKISETFKYNQTGRNQFKDRVFLEDGFVVGWKQR